jgi:hypothetical protein
LLISLSIVDNGAGTGLHSIVRMIKRRLFSLLEIPHPFKLFAESDQGGKRE